VQAKEQGVQMQMMMERDRWIPVHTSHSPADEKKCSCINGWVCEDGGEGGGERVKLSLPLLRTVLYCNALHCTALQRWNADMCVGVYRHYLFLLSPLFYFLLFTF
jgi:hypothetical protein